MKQYVRQLLTACSFLLILTACSQKPAKQDEWIQLFNGKDLKDWDIKITGHELNDNYGNTFRVEDSLLKVRYDQYPQFDEQFGHIFFKHPYSSYLLEVEYRFAGDQVKGAPGWAFRNNGLMLHSQSAASMLKDQDFPISLEVQLLGGMKGATRTTANLCTPGTNVVMDGKLITEHCISSSSKTYEGERWVKVGVLVLGDSIIQHIAEGDTVLTYSSPRIGDGDVAHFDPSVKKDGKLLKEGYIALQAESAPTDFRKIALFNLEPYIHDQKALNRVLQDLRK